MVVHSHYPVGEARAEREARAAIEAGYDVDVVCLRRTDEPARETVDDVRITRLPVEHARGVSAVRSVFEYVDFALRASVAVLRIHRREPVDVVYVHAPPDFLIVTALIPRLLGSGVVLDIHDLSPHMFNARFSGRRISRLAEGALRLVERGACSVADRVITVHEPYRDELAAHGVPRRKIAIVMNAPLPDSVEQGLAAASDRPTSDAFVVAYHGTVNHWYGVDLLVEAIARLRGERPELSGLILGEGDALPAVERLARELDVDAQIEFTRAYISNAEAIARVAGADCGVVPNRRLLLNRFALSSKLLEYVALGVPVVVARLETLEAHFGPDEVTFFEADNAESLAEAIDWVVQNPQQAWEKAQRARRRAEAYSWDESRPPFLEALSSAARDG